MKRKLIFFAAAVFLSAAAVFAGQEPAAFINGLRPPTPEQEQYLDARTVKLKTVQPNRMAFARSAAVPGLQAGLPAAANNVQYLPKVDSQGGQGSCAAWATCYYYKTYQESKEHGWGRPDFSTDPGHVASPAFCYNLVNYGVDGGSWPLFIMQLIADHGSATWRDMPYNQADYTTWPSSAAWKNAIAYRAQSAATIDLSSDAGITALKQQLANGDIAVIAMNVYDNFYRHYPSDYGGINNGVLYTDSGTYDGGHALAVIGYDDNKSYNDGTGTKYGAFKIVNSWGNSWGILDADAGTKGFFWMSYTYMRDKSYKQAWTMTDRINYQPTAYGTFAINHADRGDLNVNFTGGNNKNSPDWSFNALPYLGGNHAINQKITVDLSSYSPDFHKKFWLNVLDSAQNSATGQVTYMSVQQAGDAEKVSTDTPKSTLNGSSIYVALSVPGESLTALDPQFTQVGLSSFTVSWAAIPGAKYTAVLASDGGYSNILSSSTSASNTKSFTALSPGAEYYFQVKISTEPDTAYSYNRTSAKTPAGIWTTAAAMPSARDSHRATLLSDGRVLVTGGFNGSALSAAVIYDPGTNTWASAGSMSAARYNHTATLLPDGRVLVAGGENDSILYSAELYDPYTNAWSSAGSMARSRYYHTATLLTDGRVLVTGGYSGAYLYSAELYDPRTNTWASAAPMANSRYTHTATLLADGRVLVTGGYNTSPLSSAELYDPARDTWSGARSMSATRYYHTATPLADGRVLVAGGYGADYLSSAEIYVPSSNIWAAAAPMTATRYSHTATLLANGKVLVAGGYGSGFPPAAEVYDTAANTWTGTGAMSTPRKYHVATLLPGGQVLATGGYNGVLLSSAEVFSYFPAMLTSLKPSFSQIGSSGMTAAWASLPGASYNISLSTDANFTTLVSSGLQSANSAAFSGLSPATRYFFEVRLSTEADWAAAGNRLSGMTLPSITLLHPRFSRIYAASATVTWDDFPGADYTAVLASDSLYADILSSAPGTGSTKTFTGLTPAASYYFEVKLTRETDVVYAVNRISAATWAPPAGVPYVHDGLAADQKYAASLTALSANWGASAQPGGVDHYEIAIGTFPGGVSALNWAASGVALSTTVTGLSLKENSVYYFSVRAAGTGGAYSGVTSSDGQLVDVTGPAARVLVTSPLPARSGLLNLKLVLDEANGITGSPALTFTPPGGAPQNVPLEFVAASTWSASIFIESFFSTGTAVLTFSASDLAGNAGSVLTGGGSFAINTAVDGAAGGTVVNSDSSTVTLPPGAYNGSLLISISTIAASRLAATEAAGSDTNALRFSDLAREFSARSVATGLPVTRFPSPVSIKLCYPDTDNDGKIDGDNIPEKLAGLYWLNESSGRWTPLPGAIRDTTAKCITAQTSHFSVYSIRVMTPYAASMADVKAFPNPCYFERSDLSITGIPADAARPVISIYDTAGELVRVLKEGDGIDASNSAVWNGRNSGGQKVASGLYIYVVKTAGRGNMRGRIYVFW